MSLINLLRSLRPEFGAVGSRDVDVRAKQQAIDAELEKLAQEAITGVPQVKGPLLNERLLKQLIGEFYRRITNGEKMKVVLHSLLHEVYAQGVAAGRSMKDE